MSRGVEAPAAVGDQAEANAVRGEIALALGERGESYVLRPTFEAVRRIEALTGKGLLRLAEEAAQGHLSLAESAVIACQCIRAQGAETGDRMLENVDPDKIAEMIMEAPGGLSLAQVNLRVLLFWAATGGYTRKGELKPAETLAKVAAMLAPPEAGAKPEPQAVN